jgi:hypothetical protein
MEAIPTKKRRGRLPRGSRASGKSSCRSTFNFANVCCNVDNNYQRPEEESSRTNCGNYDGLSADDLDCPICLEMVYEPVRLKCNHLMCRECFEKLLELSSRKCPKCRRWIGGTRRLSDWLDKGLWAFILKKFHQKEDTVVEDQVKADYKLAVAIRRRERQQRFFLRERNDYSLRSRRRLLNSSVLTTTSSISSEEDLSPQPATTTSTLPCKTILELANQKDN